MIINIAFFLLAPRIQATEKDSLSTEYSFDNENTNSDSAEVDEPVSLNFTQSEFTDADKLRYTISGDLPLRNTEFRPLPAIGFTVGLAGIFIAQHVGQVKSTWYPLGDFHFAEDITQDLYVDKLGHFYGVYLNSYIFSEILMECGFSWDAASVWGGVLGLSYSSYVEILDGYARDWGFSPSDYYADLAGGVFFIGRHYIPFLQNFTPQFMYFPAEWHGNTSRIPHDLFVDDYASQTFWMSINVHNLLPKKAQDYWPSWLQLSVGYTARNLLWPLKAEELGIKYDPKIWEIKDFDVWGSPRYIIALDVDYVKLLPDNIYLNWLKQSMHHFKLPLPAIEFSPSKTRFYLIYPFGEM